MVLYGNGKALKTGHTKIPSKKYQKICGGEKGTKWGSGLEDKKIVGIRNQKARGKGGLRPIEEGGESGSEKGPVGMGTLLAERRTRAIT